MTSETLGIDISSVEVTNISPNGIWMLADDEEFFLPFDEFPWFKDARVSAILKVERPSCEHLYWPELDIDLSIESIKYPERFPLISKSGN